MFGKLKLGTKTIAAFGIAVVITLIVGAIGFTSIKRMGADITEIGVVRMPSLMGLQYLAAGQMEAGYGQRGLLVPRMMEPTLLAAQYARIEKGVTTAQMGYDLYAPLPQTTEEARIWAPLPAAWEKWKSAAQEMVDVARERDRLMAQGLALDDPRVAELDARVFAAATASRKMLEESSAIIKDLIALNQKIADEQVVSATATQKSSRAGMFAAILAGALVMFGLGAVLARTIGGIINSLLGESKKLTEAAVAGRLATRGNPQAINFEFRPIVEGINATLDAVIGPLNVAGEYVDRISKGDIPPKITDSYNGDFNEIKNNLNQCIDAVNALVADADALSDAAMRGRFDVRAEAARHHGDFRKIVEGVNRTVDTFVGHLDSMPAPAMIIDKDFTIQYMNEVGAKVGGSTGRQVIGTKCYDFFKTSDCRTERCACNRAMRDGRLASSETDAHPAGLNLEILYSGVPVKDQHGKIIGAFEVVTDQTAVKQAARRMEKVADYQNVETRKLTAALTQMAGGDLSAHVELAPADDDTAAARDMLQQILLATRTFKEAVIRLVDDANVLATAAVEGRLDTRSDVTKHQGDFRKIVAGVNATLDAVLTPIQEAAAVLETLSNYDLRARVAGDYKGDHAKIKDSLNRTAQALHDSLSQVAEAVEQVSSASGQIASSSQQVAEGASEQASSLEETSSSLEEMSSMTKQNADNTQQAKVLTESTKAAADRGAASMGQMMTAMGKIRTASEGTAQIIRDINEIAFQTNLLALNAAVEAARAGEAGRGFAVVAEEVRNLAQRSKEAAKKTEDLIHESVTLAEGGEKLSREVGTNLDEILTSVNKVAEIVNEVTTASREQAKGVDQVNATVADMDRHVQAAAASAEESSSAAQELASQAQELAAMVARFRLAEPPGAAAAPGGVRRSAPAAPAGVKRPIGPAATRPAADWRFDNASIDELVDGIELAKF
ncbi:MAG: methyl-accepting chemotaxis protein [Candidatus Krumholzibacteriia bacterium]